MKQEETLILIPKIEKYIEYVLNVIQKIPRTEKFNIGNEYKRSVYEKLKSGTYKHSGYFIFYVTEPKLRKIEKSIYMDRIVHRWVVDNFLEPYFVPTFIDTSYACLKNRGMHKACLDVQSTMKHLSRTWKDYYILKMDVRKYFQNIDKDILYKILNEKILDNKLMWLLKEIIYSNEGKKGLAIRKLYITNVCEYILK